MDPGCVEVGGVVRGRVGAGLADAGAQLLGHVPSTALLDDWHTGVSLPVLPEVKEQAEHRLRSLQYWVEPQSLCAMHWCVGGGVLVGVLVGLNMYQVSYPVALPLKLK